MTWPTIICLDSKHNNFEWLLLLALDWYNLFSGLLIWPNWVSRKESGKVMLVPIFNSGWHHRQQSQRLPPWWRSPHETPAQYWSRQSKSLSLFKIWKSHLIPELHSIEFAGMFKQLRPVKRMWERIIKGKRLIQTVQNLNVVVMNWAPSANSWIMSATAWVVFLFSFCGAHKRIWPSQWHDYAVKENTLTFLYIGSSAWSISSNK